MFIANSTPNEDGTVMTVKNVTYRDLVKCHSLSIPCIIYMDNPAEPGVRIRYDLGAVSPLGENGESYHIVFSSVYGSFNMDPESLDDTVVFEFE